MKCIAVNCNRDATKVVLKLWGASSEMGFCNEHSPDWLVKLNVGDMSPEVNTLGITKSWYKRIS